MIITCPACRTRFQLAPTSLGDRGRNVRCSSCSERWFVEPFTIAPPPPEARELVPAPHGLLRLRPPRLVAWLAAALAFLLLAALVAGRNEIAARLPAAAPIYQRFGLSLELPLGIEFRGVSTQRQSAAGGQVLVVRGEIANISPQRREVPPIRVALLDAARREVDHGLFDPPAPMLESGGAAPFEVELEAPPQEARDVAVSFSTGP